MATVSIKGYIKGGKIEIDLPENVIDGEIEVTVPVAETAGEEIPWEERPWTDEEIAEFFKFEGKPLGEIETGGWEDMDIEDSAEWVEELRRKEEERSKW